MPLASSYSYPLLGAFWTILEIFLWVLWIWVLIYVFIDIFRSHDLSGWARALWFLFVLFIPLIGVLVYLIARGDKMHERAVRQRPATPSWKRWRTPGRCRPRPGVLPAGHPVRLPDRPGHHPGDPPAAVEHHLAGDGGVRGGLDRRCGRPGGTGPARAPLGGRARHRA